MERVLCLIETNFIDELDWDEQIYWMDNHYPIKNFRTTKTIIPLIDHPHSDIENGQDKVHYHINTKYIDKTVFDLRISLPLNNNQKLEYRYLKKVRDNEVVKTPVKLISKSKLKHKCIHKGKCPHRGYDLSNEKPNEKGIITCPLHSLMFDTNNNNKIINFE